MGSLKKLAEPKASGSATANGALEAEADSDIADGQRTPESVSEEVDISVVKMEATTDDQLQVGLIVLLDEKHAEEQLL